MKTDIEIASEAKLRPIQEVANELGLDADDYDLFGKYKAKVNRVKSDKKGKLILVTAINPTPAGEGKTTISIGLADALRKLGKKTMLALREPSLGPVFGIKGGAAGGGYAQLAPMSDINLHFTGDFHAITAANNLLSAMIDNHIYFGNKLNIKTVTWNRCLDVNDRALRNIQIIYEGNRVTGNRTESFNITAASEIMAVLCLSSDFDDLKQRLSRIVIGYDQDNKSVTAGDLKASEAMAILLYEACKPNLVQTLEGTPAFVHGGPFANIAHGCNSVIATKSALKLADYVVTEAGFGADLGAEKFLNIKCRVNNLSPDCVVIVATVRALKYNGQAQDIKVEDLDALKRGLPNLLKHIDNVTNQFKLPCVVAINRFFTDTDAEINIIKEACAQKNVKAVVADVFSQGGAGGIDLANEVADLCNLPNNGINFTYSLDDDIEEKLNKIAKNIYGADGVELLPAAKKQLKKLTEDGFGNLPVCVAKTQYSLSDNPNLLGAPKGFKVTVRELQLRAGAGFIVAVAGDIMLMPGLSKVPNAEKMTIDSQGNITGLF
ncbi:MAG TPA: formate--tetrahydrofolate ligase [Clostridia bacterium]